MSETDYVTTATTTYEYDEDGYLLKEVTITETSERTDPGDRAIPETPKAYPWQYPIIDSIQQCGGGSLQSTDGFAPLYTINTARERKMTDGYL